MTTITFGMTHLSAKIYPFVHTGGVDPNPAATSLLQLAGRPPVAWTDASRLRWLPFSGLMGVGRDRQTAVARSEGHGPPEDALGRRPLVAMSAAARPGPCWPPWRPMPFPLPPPAGISPSCRSC